jgi:hypothetical protein
MRGRPERWAAWTGVLAVVLWVIGTVVTESGNVPEEGAADSAYLTHIQDDANRILTGGWIFMVGCLAFLWFAVVLRERMAQAEGGTRMFTSVAFVGAVIVGAAGMLLPGPEIAAAISSADITPTTAAALSNLSDGFFVVAELAAILLMIGVGVLSLRGALFAKGWGWFSLFLALVLVIAPIGWAALIFGLPLWVLGTTWFLSRGERVAPAVQPI